LTSNVVTAAISDASYAAQIRVTQNQIDGQRRLFSLLEQQFSLGAVSEADVLSQKAQLAQTLALLPPLQKARAQERDQLMAYLGRLPSQDKGETVALEELRLPRDLPVSVPSLLVRQRPDIRAAESQVHKASANVGVATANMLPNLTLSASGGSQALTLSALYGPQTAVWSVAASVTGPIFDAGSLFHTKESKVAALEETRAQYRSTVLTAFQNVADSLRAIQFDATLLKAQVEAENAAADSLRISQAQFKGGSTTFLTIINAEQTLLTARTNRVKAQASRYADTVALYQSLGGGWWHRTDETPASEAKPAGIAGIFVPFGALPPPSSASVN
jgi:NodT family efflux transporter outer membrane factor (OMF) lipoprotein